MQQALAPAFDTPIHRHAHSARSAALALEGIFAVAVLFVASGAVFPLLRRLGGEGTVTVTSGGGPEGLIYRCAFLATVVLLLPLRNRVADAIRSDPLLWLLPALAMVSTAWSTDPSHTLKSAVMLLGSMLFATYLALRFGAEGQLHLLAWLFALLIVLSVASVYVEPYVGIDRGMHAGVWRGVFGHKNLFGRALALAFSAYAVLGIYKPDWRPVALLFGVATLPMIWLSHSRTSLVVVGLMCVYIAARPLLGRVRIRNWMIAALILAVVLAVVSLSWSQRENLIVRGEGADSLTGRTVLWAASLLKITERPLLGYGFAGFWEGRGEEYMSVWRLVGWTAPNSHNAFLDVTLDLGIVGLALFTLVCVRTMTRTLALHRSPTARPAARVWPAGVVAFLLVAFMTEGQLLQNHIYWMLFTAAAVLGGSPESAKAPREHAGLMKGTGDRR